MIAEQTIAVVVPSHNEARHIANVVQTIPAWVDLVVVVDDASSDDTCAIVAALCDRRVELLSHPQNRGVGASIASGYRQARLRGADVVVVMAGDGQMDPADLRCVVEPALAGEADYVKGNRLRHPEVGRMPLQRRIGTQVLAWLTGRAVGLPDLSDSQCGYTAITGKAIDALDLQGLWPRYGYPNDLVGQLCARGLRIREVVVRPIYKGEYSGLRARHVPVIVALIARAAWRVRIRPRGC